METGLAGKGALVTGASGGIGAACARALAAEGTRVLVHYHGGEERARAVSDALGGMPIAQADPFGGVILTDWYAPPETPQERFKVNVFILDRQLRSDGLKAVVFRQTRHANGGWVDAAVEPKTANDLELTILSRARQIRVDQAGS